LIGNESFSKWLNFISRPIKQINTSELIQKNG
jgi:hypothetical protein